MAEKSVLRRPHDIDTVINRGGSSVASHEENKEKERIAVFLLFRLVRLSSRVDPT